MPPAGTPTTPPADFVRDVTRSRALDEHRLLELLASLPDARGLPPAKVADHLVAAGGLTRFQADKLLRGHWRGLALGPYRLLSPIGRGGMGIVYLARVAGPHDRAGELGALKVLPPQRAKDEPRTLARFQREMEIGLRLPSHPHLTRTLDAGVEAGVHYLAMEYVPGKTVRQLVAEGGPLPIGRAARVFADVAAGLNAAHRAGFVHRDLKPSNVVVDAAGRAKVLDFGFALILGETAPADPAVLGGQGYTLGTMDFLAPEQAADAAAVGPAADLYALGCSLYYAVTGCLPFPGGTAQDKIRWHRTSVPPSAAQINPAVPAEFARLIDRLMAKQPEMRPASADEVVRELNPWADPVRTQPVGGRATANVPDWVHEVEVNWQASQNGSAGVPDSDESLVILGESDVVPSQGGAPVAASQTLHVPVWLAAAVLAAFFFLLVLVTTVGWLLARWVGR